MHIARLRIQNYRCFADTMIEFRGGLNVVVGENNAGKSALFNAMRLVFEPGVGAPSLHDFHFRSLDGDEPPSIVVTATIQVEENDPAEDKAAVAAWLTKYEFPWEAELSYVFELPEKHKKVYEELRESYGDGPAPQRSSHAIEWLLDEGRFVGKHYGGVLSNRFGAEPELRSHFRCRFLDALRDAESHLKSGSAQLLQRMLRRVLDRRVEKGVRIERQRAFRVAGEALVGNLAGRLSTNELFEAAKGIWGAGQHADPELHGRLTEIEVLRSILLFLDRGAHRHPVSHNGLGYNNLLYVGLVLASMDIDVLPDELQGFPLLLMEEPEAHLHPALQYRFLVFLREQLEQDADGEGPKSRQVFLTTHSTHVTSAAGLDPLVCLFLDEQGEPQVAYPGRAFPDTKDGCASKAYVERFLDATKSSMLFAKAVLLVEGIAEQVLIPSLVDLAWGGRGSWLDRNFVSLVRVDGVTFKHFLPLFGMVEDPDLARMGLGGRRVALVTDGDPVRDVPYKNKKGTKAKACWPYEPESRDSPTAASLLELMEKHKPRLFVGVAGKTFEYDLVSANPKAAVLLTDATAKKKRRKLEGLMGDDDLTAALWKKWFKKQIEPLVAFLDDCDDEDVRRRTALATYYLLAYKDSKGEHASMIAAALAAELAKDSDKRQVLKLPDYLDGALRHVCILEPPPPEPEEPVGPEEPA